MDTKWLKRDDNAALCLLDVSTGYSSLLLTPLPGLFHILPMIKHLKMMFTTHKKSLLLTFISLYFIVLSVIFVCMLIDILADNLYVNTNTCDKDMYLKL